MNFSSGLNAVDSSLFDGTGVPPGRILQIHGEADSGKTALALWYCRTLLEQDPQAVVGWVSTESPLTATNLAWAGIEPERFALAVQSSSLSGLELAYELLQCEGQAVCDLIVVDSVAGLVELRNEKDLVELRRIIGRWLPKISRRLEETGAALILLNQERQLPGRGRYVPGACPTLRRYTDAQLRLRSGEMFRRAAVETGFRVHFVVQSGRAPGAPLQGRFNLHFDGGLSDLRQLSVVTPGGVDVSLPV